VRRPAEAADFARVYDDEVWNVYGFFGYRVASREHAEDLTQLTFERALAAWDRFDPRRASVRTWLMAIAHNILVDHYRAGATAAQEPLPEGDAEQAALGSEPSPESNLGLSPELESALGELGARERELIALRFGADMSGPEIAELTGLSLSNVHQILSRSMRRLREKLGEPVPK
jgi:RNA polymerase sigma-70 factor, ECF subfamily